MRAWSSSQAKARRAHICTWRAHKKLASATGSRLQWFVAKLEAPLRALRKSKTTTSKTIPIKGHPRRRRHLFWASASCWRPQRRAPPARALSSPGNARLCNYSRRALKMATRRAPFAVIHSL